MNTYRRLTIIALAAGVLAVLCPDARAELGKEALRVTFSGPVEVPGEVLPAGTYIFEALQNGRLTRILSADERHIYATLITVPDDQRDPVEKPTVILGESPQGTPVRVAAWFYPGDSVGNEFLFKRTSSRKGVASIMGSVAKDTGKTVEETPKAVAMSSEFVAVHTGRAVANSSVAIVHGAKHVLL